MSETATRETESGTIIQFGFCRYCGQQHSFNGIIDMSEEQKTTMATSMCDCAEALEETARLDGVELATKNARELLDKYQFKEEFIDFIELIAQKKLDQITCKVDNVTFNMKLSNNCIKITKKVTTTSTKEA